MEISMYDKEIVVNKIQISEALSKSMIELTFVA